MSNLMTSIGEFLFINKTGNENPFTMAEESFYVRVIAVKRGWVAYFTDDKKTGYMPIDDFRNNFEYPDLLYGSVCAKFADKNATLNLISNKVIDNPYKGKIPLDGIDEFTSSKMIHKEHKSLLKKIKKII